MLIILILIFAAIPLCAYFAYRKAFHVSPSQRNTTMPLPAGEQYVRYAEQSRALADEMRALPFEPVEITARDGTKLFGCYYHVRDGAPLQIQFHGYRGSPVRDFCGGNKLARSLGQNTLVVSQRGRGKSGGNAITFGIRERFDCVDWVNYACRRFGADYPILLAGVSMGASTVIMACALGLPENVLGVIADSPYSSPEKIIRKVCRDMHLPPAAAFPFVRLGARMFAGFDPCCATATEAAAASKKPILLIHGEDDRFVPCSMAAEIHAANPEYVTLETFPGAGHGLSYMVDTPRYSELVSRFSRDCLQKFSMISK